jgi:hypothetical protein
LQVTVMSSRTATTWPFQVACLFPASTSKLSAVI